MVISSRRSQEIIFHKVIHLSYQFDDIYVVFMSCIINTYTFFELMDVLDIGRGRDFGWRPLLVQNLGVHVLWMIGWRPHQVFNHCTPYFGTIYWRLTNDFIETFLFYRLKNNCNIVSLFTLFIFLNNRYSHYYIYITYKLQQSRSKSKLMTEVQNSFLVL